MDAAAHALAIRLGELARNLWWTWQPDVVAVFRDLDPVLWREVNHNPAAFLAAMPADQLVRRAEATALESRINFSFHRLEQYLRDRRTWGDAVCGPLRARPVAYFAVEFALHESLPLYSGGLGALAGDHLKAASDLGVPLVGIGIFYGEGYFRQRIDATGWQQESYGQVPVERLPLRRALRPDGTPVLVEIPLDGDRLRIGAWRAEVGRATLLLLDSDVEGNSPALRGLTAQLYGGDQRLRLRQEMILGIGGVRMLDALGVRPGVVHLNEGHSAFAPIELARQQAAAEGLAFDLAHRNAAMCTVFTTHTPVPAGHDYFPPDLVLEHLGWLQREVGLTPEEFLALGRVNRHDAGEPFCMTVLALRSSYRANGVSAIHGRTTRQMWRRLWPDRQEPDVPIGHVTNGVHVPSWIAPQVARLCETYLGPGWETRADALKAIDTIDEVDFWETHQVIKRNLLHYVARRCAAQAAARGEDPAGGAPALDGEILTLGFARRFAEYKRATLLLDDLARLARLVNAPGRGLQLIFAGKAHPRDDAGKRLVQRVLALARDPVFRGRIVFVEDYDFGVARHLVQGCDAWLNTPRRPFEACGTSGQKVVLNGGLNVSILDGWWAEAFDGENGFAIGEGLTHSDPAVQDARDAAALYRLLEEEVVPLYYERDAAGIPRRWLSRVRRAVRTLAPRFNAYRMVRDYVRHCYLPAAGVVSSDVYGPTAARP